MHLRVRHIAFVQLVGALLMKTRIICCLLILGLLIATNTQADSYRTIVKKGIKDRLETYSVGIEKLDSGEGKMATVHR